ncbi:hypothetical protein MCUN1_001944 [Malassezia cuniculi]|uniref:Uncharacterized protein n=1 Tax=Malassezia cuniculi TaxID=948313 RepID=A0AAF0ERC6_9BASI|nr:hypothetical protein MCUN1_001944 [Malassezia cuniculi]
MDSQTIASDSDSESDALAADGDGVWEQAYCVVCDCLIEPPSTNTQDDLQWEMAAVSALRTHTNALRAPTSDKGLFDRVKQPLYCSDKCRDVDNARSTGLQELVQYVQPSSVGSQASLQSLRSRGSFMRNSIAAPQSTIAQSMPVRADTYMSSSFRGTSLATRGRGMPFIRVQDDADSIEESAEETLAFSKQPLSPRQLGQATVLGARPSNLTNLQRTWAQQASGRSASASASQDDNGISGTNSPTTFGLGSLLAARMQRTFSLGEESSGSDTGKSLPTRSMSFGVAERASAADTPESGVLASSKDFSPREQHISAVEQLRQAQARDSPRRASVADAAERTSLLGSISSVWTSVVGAPEQAVDENVVAPEIRRSSVSHHHDDTHSRRDKPRRSAKREVQVLPPVFGPPVDHRARFSTSASSRNAPLLAQRNTSQVSLAKWHAAEEGVVFKRPTTPKMQSESGGFRSSRHLSPGSFNSSSALAIPGTSPRRAGLGWKTWA